MKHITKTSRLAGLLERLFRDLNTDIFNNQLDTPIITISPTKRAYAHYTPFDAWNVNERGKREINIASGTLNRPLENIVASLLHEMVHFYDDTVLHVQDCSRGGTYHNKQFAKSCTTHGLTVTHSDRYGWNRTELNDDMIMWLLEYDEFREIEMCRDYYAPDGTSSGAKTADGGRGNITVTTTVSKSSSRRYVCPFCGMIIRATKQVNVICGDCMTKLIET